MPRLVSLSVIASLVFFALPVQAQELLRWETDLATAQKQAAASNRLVLVHFWGPWCPPCMEMEKSVFSRPNLGTAINPYFVPVKIQVDEGMNQDLAKQFGVDGYPCDIVMTAQGQIIAKEKGYKPAEKYVAMLNEIAQKGLAQARSNGLGPVATTPPAATAPPTAPTAPAAPVSTRAAADAARYANVPPSDNRYAAYAPPVAAQAAPYAAGAAGIPNTNAPTANAPTANAPVAAGRPATPPADDRYAAYYQSRGVAAPSAPAAPVSAAPTAAASVAPTAPTTTAVPAPVAAAPVAAPATSVAPAAPPVSTPVTASTTTTAASPPVAAASVQSEIAKTQAPVAAPSAAPAASTNTAANPTGSATAGASPKSPLEAQLPPGSPPLALEGYCPVTVVEKLVWTKGNPLYGAIHLNRTYLFPTAEQQAKFLANPDRYSPIISGNDPVVALEKNEIVSGQRQFGLLYENRMILFSSKESYDKFCKESKRYTTELQQALQSSNAIRR